MFNFIFLSEETLVKKEMMGAEEEKIEMMGAEKEKIEMMGVEKEKKGWFDIFLTWWVGDLMVDDETWLIFTQFGLVDDD